MRAFLLVAIVGCSAPTVVTAPPPPPKVPPFVDAWLDRSADPCTSLYQFACGTWLKTAPIPADRMVMDTSFVRDADRTLEVLHAILEEAARGSSKLGDAYAACMDDSKADASIATLKARLAQIDAIATPADLAREIAQMQLEIYDWQDVPLFSFSPIQDRDDARQMIGQIDPAGLGFPDRDYYVKDDPGRRAMHEKFQAYRRDLLVLLGEPPARADADVAATFAIETSLARAHLDRAVRLDPELTHHRLDRAELRALAPSFDWDTYFAAAGIPDIAAINVSVPAFVQAIEPLVRPDRIAALKSYLRWFEIAPTVRLLGPQFVQRRFEYRKAISGVTAAPPRWQECVEMLTETMPQALGRTYVERAFGSDAKARAVDMVERIETAFDQNLDTLAWMDAPTRAAAHAKLKKIANKIGYPASWRDYSGLAVDRGTPLANYFAGLVYESRRQLAKIGKPVDRTEMMIDPQSVNANYSSAMNEMNFPAGILQPPFFAADAPAAANFGGIGFVVGHELTHGFDNNGRRFDGDGNQRPWWSTASDASYTAKTACVADQYSGYVAVDDVHLDGKATLAENIADNGGLKLAFDAFQTAQRGAPEQPYEGFTESQQFFIAFAQTWCTNIRPESARLFAQLDEHSAHRWRVDGSAQNLPAFAAAFHCTAGAPMAPTKRCDLW